MMSRSLFRKITLASTAMLFALTVAMPAQAYTILPKCATEKSVKAADLNCALATFENIAELILGLTGSFALLMFVYGGFTLLSSGGAEEKVTKGKTIIRNAVIGILVIMLSGYLVTYGVNSLKGTSSGDVSCTAPQKAYTLKDGSKVCASGCGQVAGYSCDPNSTGRSDCLVGLCPGDASNRCCPSSP